MANWTGLILTNKGRLLHAKVEIGTCKLPLTKFKIGNGILPAGQSLEALTDLISPKQNVSISTLTDNHDGSVTATGTVTNTGLATGYNVTELGVFATDPDDGEILYAITTDSNPDYLPAAGGATVVAEEFNLNIAITNSSNVTATIDMASIATIGDVTTKITAHINALHYPLKRSTAYAVGDIAYHADLPSWGYLECTTAGTTGTTEPTIPTTEGATLTDGTAVFKLRRKAVNAPMCNKRDVITTSGTYTAPVTGWYKITVKGGGGGGAGGIFISATNFGSGGGGGEGGTCIRYHKLTAGDTATVVVGAGGAGGAVGSYGNPGGNSTVTIGSTVITAYGGGYGGVDTLQYGRGGSGDIYGAAGQTGEHSANENGFDGGAGGGAGGGVTSSSHVAQAGVNGGGGCGGYAVYYGASDCKQGAAGGNGYVWFEYFDNSLN